MKSFVIASSKPWHLESYKRFKKKNDIKSFYATDTKTINLILKKNKSIKYIFFLHWNWKVPGKIFQKYECICFHMTDLPKGRGGSPLQNLILDGKKKTTICAFRMTDLLDSGPIYKKKKINLNGRAEDIYKNVSKVCFDMISYIIRNGPIPKDQKGSPTFFKRRNPKQSLLPKNISLSKINDYIRMLDAPTYPLAFIEHGVYKFEFSFSKLFKDNIVARVKITKK